MKLKKLLVLSIAALLALSGCNRDGVDVIVNVDGYEGIILATENTVAAPVPIPDEPVFTSSSDISQAEETGTGDIGEDTEPAEDTSQTDPPVHTDSPPITVGTTKATWAESPQSGTMYVNTDGIYSRVAALMGSARVDRYDVNQAVEILAKTDTDYFKVSGGAYIHADYLGTEQVSISTEETMPESENSVTVPEETEPPITNSLETDPADTEPTETDPTVTEPILTAPSEEGLTPIMGSSVANAEQMRRYVRKMNPDVEDSVIDMIPYYLSEGAKEGVRGDIAFAQSCLETGYFRFEKTGTGSAVTIDQNNFCGMGVTSLGIKGESFETPQIGIRAQIQHLKAYASDLPLNGDRVDNRFAYVVRGCAPYVEWLGMQENPSGKGWAGGKNYGSMILNIYSNILAS